MSKAPTFSLLDTERLAQRLGDRQRLVWAQVYLSHYRTKVTEYEAAAQAANLAVAIRRRSRGCRA